MQIDCKSLFTNGVQNVHHLQEHMSRDALSTGQLQCLECPVINWTVPQLSVPVSLSKRCHVTPCCNFVNTGGGACHRACLPADAQPSTCLYSHDQVIQLDNYHNPISIIVDWLHVLGLWMSCKLCCVTDGKVYVRHRCSRCDGRSRCHVSVTTSRHQ